MMSLATRNDLKTSPVRTWVVIFISGIAGSIFAYLAWPGFMSYDSVYALSQARNGIISGTYPPMVSYLWWLLELVVKGQGGMLAFQVVLLFIAGALCVWEISRSIVAAIVFSALIPLLPALAGPLLVVWKDILFSGALILTLYATSRLKETSFRTHTNLWLACIALVLLTASLRLNGLPALLPAIYFIARACFPSASIWHRITEVMIGVVLVAGVVFAVSTWRLPDFHRIQPTPTQRYVMFHDLLGISSCMGVQVFSTEVSEGLDFNSRQLKSLYHPEHVQRSFGTEIGLTEQGLASVHATDWLREIAHHPRCYIEHKLNVISYMLGYNSGDVFYVTDPGVFQNSMGLKSPTPQRVSLILNRVLKNTGSIFARPFTYFLLACGALLMLWRMGFELKLAAALMASSLLYLSVNAVLLSGADLRYQYAEVCQWFVICIGGFGAVTGRYFTRASLVTRD